MPVAQDERSTREKVAELLEAGLSVIAISRALGISQQAVYGHIYRGDLKLPSEKRAAS